MKNTIHLPLSAVLASLLLLPGSSIHAEHRDPLQILSGRSSKKTTATKTHRQTPSRHYSPLEAMNGKLVLKKQGHTPPSSQKRSTSSLPTAHQVKVSSRPIMPKKVPGRRHPSTHSQPVAPADQLDTSLEFFDLSGPSVSGPNDDAEGIIDAPNEQAPHTRTAKRNRSENKRAARPTKDFHTIDGMILPPPSEEATVKKATPKIVVTEPEYDGERSSGVQPNPPAPVPQKAYHVPQTKQLYMTFDDGPVNGTANLLRLLKNENVKATMFFIGREVHHSPRLFQRALAMPNLLVANHTYTHANDHYRRFYNSPVRKVVADIDKAQAAIGGAKYLRLCGRNVWRLPKVKRNDWGISVAQRGREVSKYNALWNRGYFIYGWDVEWSFSHKTQRPLFSGEEMARRVNEVYRSRHVRKPGKVIMLAHDFMFRSDYNVGQLRTFIHIMKAQGWHFKTIDEYSNSSPDVYVRHGKKTDPTQLRPAQKLAKKAKILIPENKPVVVKQPVVTQKRIDPTTQLIEAIRNQSFLEIRRLLSQKRTDINAKDIHGDIPLNVAIQTNNAVLVRMLVERGARIFNLDAKGMSPMGVARANNNTIIIRYLKKQIALQQELRLRQTVFASNESIDR